MTKWIVGLLVLLNVALFSWMRWGSALTVDVDAVTAQSALHPEKIKLLELSALSAVAPTTRSTPGMTLTLSPVSMPVSTPTAPVLPTLTTVETNVQPKMANCAEWGEFSGSDLAQAQQALAALKLGDKLTQRTVERNHGFWVYIPPLKKRSQVEKKIAQLQERGVTDYFVVQEKGKWLNAISLGVFKSEEAAQKFLTVLQSKDVRTAKIGERVSKLKYVVFAVKGVEAGMATKLSAMQKDFPDSELKLSACGN